MKKNKIWIENVKYLFYEHHLIPSKNMSLESKMNSITRFVIVVFLFLLFSEVFNMKNNIIFLVFSLFIIIILYYKQKNQMEINQKVRQNLIRENFEHNYNTKTDTPARTCTSTARINYICSKPDDENINKIKYGVNKYNEQKDYNSRGYNPNFQYPTDNQFLAGGPNPKTLVPPIIPVPAMDIDFWKENDRITISTMNTKKDRYQKESGYDISNEFNDEYHNPQNYDCKVRRKNNHKFDKPKKMMTTAASAPENQPQVNSKEAFEFPYEIKAKGNFLNSEDSLYYKDFKKNPYFKNKYSDNVFDEIVTPGNYKTIDRNEPINSNIGISLTQTFEDDDSTVIEPFENVNMSNVYDPRFSGYGTSYRSYVDKNLGQPRFYYDDINAIKMPNYITRSNIDVTPFGDSYGPMNNEGNRYNSNIHQLADQHYGDSMMQFRTEMQERLMRKTNAESWQQKMYPINRHSKRA